MLWNYKVKNPGELSLPTYIYLMDDKFLLRPESRVMGITPAPTYEFSSVDEGQSPGFTPLNSFESDIMGITPLDSSSSDYQISLTSRNNV